MKYYVTVNVKGRVVVEIDASCVKEAEANVNNVVSQINFGELQCVDWEPIGAENEAGEYEEL